MTTTTDQLHLFDPGHSLADVLLELRLAGAIAVIGDDQALDVDQRLDLLALVVAPASCTEAAR